MDRSQFIVFFDSGIQNKDQRVLYSLFKIINDFNYSISIYAYTLETYKRSSKASSSKTIDGLTDVESVAKLFAGKYKELYSSVPYDKSELPDIINDLKLSMSDSKKQSNVNLSKRRLTASLPASML